MYYLMTMARIKKPVTLALDRAILARLEAWMKTQDAPWTKTAAFEQALSDWLDAKGAAPSKPPST